MFGSETEETSAIHDLHEVADRLNRRGMIAEIWIESGDPVEKILQVCRDGDIQLIVQTTQGRSGKKQRPPESWSQPLGTSRSRAQQEVGRACWLR